MVNGIHAVHTNKNLHVFLDGRERPYAPRFNPRNSFFVRCCLRSPILLDSSFLYLLSHFTSLFLSLSLNKLGENVLTRSYSLSQIFIYAEFDPKKCSSRALDLNIKYFFYLKFLSKKPKRNCEKTVEEIKIVATCSRKKRIKLAKARLFSD